MGRSAGYGATDETGDFYFKATGDGQIKLGNTSDDLIHLTGTLEVNGDLKVGDTIKTDYYITTPSTQDLGSGTSSTLSIGSSLMFLDADSITGVDMGFGTDVHTLTLPNGTTNGQRLTLVVEGNMGAAGNIAIQISGSLLGAVDFFMPDTKTSLNFVYYSAAAISSWYQV